MTSFSNLHPDKIAQTCFTAFDNLSKTGKPVAGKEWTVLSCILKYNSVDKSLEVVSLGTGTKCIGKESLRQNGDVLNDSHAEIMARRGFLRYILEEISKVKLNENSIFEYNCAKFTLKEQISFHFFTTHSPCGDASIFKIDQLEPAQKKIKLDCHEYKNDDVGNVILNNITGGKLIKTDNPDLMDQVIGEIRTKPGRGIRTLSVSCSDKLSRWNILGIQGALLCILLDAPIYLKSFTICGSCSITAIERAFWTRWSTKTIELSNKFVMQKPDIRKTSSKIIFKHWKCSELQPLATSIVWCNVKNSPLQVAVAGKRQGITKKNFNSPAGRLLISKIDIFKEFLNVVKNYPDINNKLKLDTAITYRRAKEKSVEYTKSWNYLKESVFGKWTVKPKHLKNFLR